MDFGFTVAYRVHKVIELFGGILGIHARFKNMWFGRLGQGDFPSGQNVKVPCDGHLRQFVGSHLKHLVREAL